MRHVPAEMRQLDRPKSNNSLRRTWATKRKVKEPVGRKTIPQRKSRKDQWFERWSGWDSNPRPPGCKPGALPAELPPRRRPIRHVATGVRQHAGAIRGPPAALHPRNHSQDNSVGGRSCGTVQAGQIGPGERPELLRRVPHQNRHLMLAHDTPAVRTVNDHEGVRFGSHVGRET